MEVADTSPCLYAQGGVSLHLNLPKHNGMPCVLIPQGGGLYIAYSGQAHLTQCNIFDNEAAYVSPYLLAPSLPFSNTPMDDLRFAPRGAASTSWVWRVWQL